MKESGDRLLLLRNTVQENRLVGVARLRYLAPDELFAVLGQVSLADQVRRHTYGEILLISGYLCRARPDDQRRGTAAFNRGDRTVL